MYKIHQSIDLSHTFFNFIDILRHSNIKERQKNLN